MPILFIILVSGILIHDNIMAQTLRPIAQTWLGAVGLMILPKLILVGSFALCCRHTAKDMNRRQIRRLERIEAIAKLIMIALFVGDLIMGNLIWIRYQLGDWILLDECLLLGLTVLVQIAMWRLYYPIDRHLRQTIIFFAIDQGRPVYPIWSANQFLLAQIRHNMLMPGLPLILLMGWTEWINNINPAQLQVGSWNLAPLLTGAGAAAVFLAAPWCIRYLWDTVILPQGPLRQRLEALCRQYHIGIRQLLLWRTFGGVANGAVIGMFAPLRYILLSDALLDQTPDEQIEAVMAHEIGHIRHHHFRWMILGTAAMLCLFEYFGSLTAWLMGQWLNTHWPSLLQNGWITDQTIQVISLVAAVICWAFSFGWFSRRLERQADTFAVQHFARSRGHETLEPDDCMAMSDALEHVATINHLRKTRPSWRHGSIAWRQQYLQQLAYTPVSRPAIGRTLRRLKIAIVLVGIFMGWIYLDGAKRLETWLTQPDTPQTLIVAYPIHAS